MFDLDKPIEKNEDDLLERSKFAERIAKNLKDYKDEDCLVLGLEGEWGSGKTSLINMVIENLGDNEFIVFKFNPWNYSTRNQLIRDFFNGLSEEGLNKEDSEVSKKLGKDLKKYAKILKPLSSLPPISLIQKLMESLGECLDKKEESLEKIRDDLNKGLRELGKKILIIIDDVDRLSDEEVREIFQLVKSLGDFPNIVYLLSYDLDIVSNSLNKTQHEKGKEYIEKVVNIAITIPKISEYILNRIWIKEVENIFGKELLEDNQFDRFQNEVGNLEFLTMRKLKRYLNALKFNSKYVKGELCITDYLALSYIKIFEKELYEFIRDNKNILTSEKIKVEGKKIKEEFLNIKILEFLFPMSRFLNLNYNKEDEEKFESERNITANKFFDLYFLEELPSNKVSRIDLRLSVESSEKFQSCLENYTKDNRQAEFLDSFKNWIEKINKEELKEYLLILNKIDYNSKRIYYVCLRIVESEENIDEQLKLYTYLGENELGENNDLLFTLLKKFNLNNKDVSEELKKELKILTFKLIEKLKKTKYETNELLSILYFLKEMGEEEKTKEIVLDIIESKGVIGYLEKIISKDSSQRKYIFIENISNFIEEKVVEEKIRSLEEEVKKKNQLIIDLFNKKETLESSL